MIAILPMSHCDALLYGTKISISIVMSSAKSNLFLKVQPKAWTLLKSNLFQSVVSGLDLSSALVTLTIELLF